MDCQEGWQKFFKRVGRGIGSRFMPMRHESLRWICKASGRERANLRSMMEFDDCRWDGLEGGYRMPFDPRPLLIKLEARQDTEAVWDQLWQEAHHQGDVGEASFAMVPHLVRIVRDGGAPGRNAYAIVGIIELRRNEGGNPYVPDWLRDDYFNAIRDLAAIALSRIERAHDPEEIKVMLSIIAMEKGLREHARFLLQYSEEELQQMDFRE